MTTMAAFSRESHRHTELDRLPGVSASHSTRLYPHHCDQRSNSVWYVDGESSI